VHACVSVAESKSFEGPYPYWNSEIVLKYKAKDQKEGFLMHELKSNNKIIVSLFDYVGSLTKD